MHPNFKRHSRLWIALTMSICSTLTSSGAEPVGELLTTMGIHDERILQFRYSPFALTIKSKWDGKSALAKTLPEIIEIGKSKLLSANDVDVVGLQTASFRAHDLGEGIYYYHVTFYAYKNNPDNFAEPKIIGYVILLDGTLVEGTEEE